MKITHLIYSFTFGGAETMLVDIVNHQVELGEVVNLIIINKIYNKALLNKIDKRVKTHFINRIESSKSLYPVFKLNLLLLKLKADILHCHNHNIIPLIISLFKKKAILTLHCLGIPTKYLSKYHQLFSISNSVKKDIITRAQMDSFVIYNGISTSLIKKKIDYNLQSIFKIISVGRIEHLIKGQHLSIEAINLLKDKGITNIQLDLIGAGSSEQYLKELTVKYGLTDQVNFLGLKDRDYIYSHLKDYDLLLQPSLFEGFGLTVAEGMAAKVPVLVSDVDGPMEIIENGKYGFHFESGNAEKLAEQIKYIMTIYNSETLKQMVEAAYQNTSANFEISTTAKQYMQNY